MKKYIPIISQAFALTALLSCARTGNLSYGVTPEDRERIAGKLNCATDKLKLSDNQLQQLIDNEEVLFPEQLQATDSNGQQYIFSRQPENSSVCTINSFYTLLQLVGLHNSKELPLLLGSLYRTQGRYTEQRQRAFYEQRARHLSKELSKLMDYTWLSKAMMTRSAENGGYRDTAMGELNMTYGQAATLLTFDAKNEKVTGIDRVKLDEWVATEYLNPPKNDAELLLENLQFLNIGSGMTMYQAAQKINDFGIPCVSMLDVYTSKLEKAEKDIFVANKRKQAWEQAKKQFLDEAFLVVFENMGRKNEKHVVAGIRVGEKELLVLDGLCQKVDEKTGISQPYVEQVTLTDEYIAKNLSGFGTAYIPYPSTFHSCTCCEPVATLEARKKLVDYLDNRTTLPKNIKSREVDHLLLAQKARKTYTIEQQKARFNAQQ